VPSRKNDGAVAEERSQNEKNKMKCTISLAITFQSKIVRRATTIETTGIPPNLEGTGFVSFLSLAL
jgi:hypothetical protein